MFPWILARAGRDPAFGSGPVATIIQDIASLLIYFGLDQAFSLAYIGEEIAERPYITVGFTAWVLLLPLAITSTKGWIRRLGGRRWNLLHRLVYVAAVTGTVHYLWAVKLDTFWPFVYFATFAALLGVRVWMRVRRR